MNNDDYLKAIYPDSFDERQRMPIWKEILLWIALLPGAILGSIIATFLMNIIMWLGSSRFGDDSWFSYIYREIIVQGISGAAWVYCAGFIAPRGKTATTITFAAVLLFISGISFFSALSAHEWMSLLGVVCLNAGAIIVAVGVATAQIDFK